MASAAVADADADFFERKTLLNSWRISSSEQGPTKTLHS
jgi:hypothetical protein